MIKILPHIISRSAEKVPDNIAYKCGADQLTYDQFHKKTSQLARALVEMGVKKGDRVGIYMYRSIETALAIHGILKCGAVYVPMDPNAPISRIEYILHDCEINVLISSDLLSKRLSDLLESPNYLIKAIIGVETSFATVRQCSWSEVDQFICDPYLNDAISEDDLAYIIYTSGTTGDPKGIMHTHRSGLAYARLSADLYGVRSEDILANHSPIFFDISTMGILTMPYVGGTTVIVSEMHTKLPSSLAQLMSDEKITIWYSVPLAIMQMCTMGVLKDKDTSSLRWLLYGGEPFPIKHLTELLDLLPNTQCSNVYGPAEVNQCTYYNFSTIHDEWKEVPLGKEWDETKIKIIDDNLEKTIEGEVGELLVHSVTMMAGYWNNPELTRKSIMNLPDEEGQVIPYYRTGDLVKTLPSGDLQFMGRKDRQIKVRGYRVELNGIESTLTDHPCVKEAAVYVIKNADETNAIEAIVTLEGKSNQLTDIALFDYLGSVLPGYSVPSKIIIGESIPRTAAGKIDHKALENKVNLSA